MELFNLRIRSNRDQNGFIKNTITYYLAADSSYRILWYSLVYEKFNLWKDSKFKPWQIIMHKLALKYKDVFLYWLFSFVLSERNKSTHPSWNFINLESLNWRLSTIVQFLIRKGRVLSCHWMDKSGLFRYLKFYLDKHTIIILFILTFSFT